MAKLYFRYGAMNSGKSTNMLQAAFNYEERGQQVLLTKPQIDTKGDTAIVSRLGVTRPVDFLITPQDDLWDLFTQKRAQFEAKTGKPLNCL
ncbi:MAG: thymidine kinase, partial [Cryobacterium sp.]|nr:thymidine kinase [Cryobacterium sp.]